MCRFGASQHFQPCQAVGGLDSDMFASSLLRFCRLIRLVRVVHPGGILYTAGGIKSGEMFRGLKIPGRCFFLRGFDI